jgi:hypothetical protein
MRWPLDHVFHDASFRLEHLEVLGPFGSDHFPVHVVLAHDEGAVHDREAPDADDQHEADEKIREGLKAG